jgi:hypothetical protein
MKLTEQLEILKAMYEVGDSEKFKEQHMLLMKNFTSESDEKQIEEFTQKMINESLDESDRNMAEIRLRSHLILNKDLIPVSYIAKNYFKKSKEWIYQRINGNLVNGKPARFSETEIETFNFALQDISKRIGSINII